MDSASTATAHALARFHAEVSPRLLAELRDSGTLQGANEARVTREWRAVSLHACVRGVLGETVAGEARADLVDAFHDEALGEEAAERAFVGERYAEYDGLSRTRGRSGAEHVPADIAAAFARHCGAARPETLAEAATPLLEALAEGAAALLAPESATLSLPPLEGLRALTTRLDDAGLAWAVGGSGLLAAYGLVERVNDWDLQVESGPELLREMFADVPHSFHGHGGCHADWKLGFESERIELIPRFAFFVPGGVVRIPLHVSRAWRGFPIAGPEAWACAYALMGEFDEPALRARRAERADRLLGWLATHGADEARLAELLREPLPGSVRARLDALPRTSG